MVVDSGTIDEPTIKETLAPFIESYGLVPSLEDAELVCEALCTRLRTMGLRDEDKSADLEAPKLLDNVVVISEVANSAFSAEEQATLDTLWGFDQIRGKRNETIEMTEAGSAKYERKAAKDQRKWLEELEAKFCGEEETVQISAMTLPDYSGSSRERDIQVNNFSITYGGHILLEGADLRLSYGRRYGLVGRNGIQIVL